MGRSKQAEQLGRIEAKLDNLITRIKDDEEDIDMLNTTVYGDKRTGTAGLVDMGREITSVRRVVIWAGGIIGTLLLGAIFQGCQYIP